MIVAKYGRILAEGDLGFGVAFVKPVLGGVIGPLPAAQSAAVPRAYTCPRSGRPFWGPVPGPRVRFCSLDPSTDGTALVPLFCTTAQALLNGEENMPATIKGVLCPSLPILRPILNKWITTNIDLVRYWRTDLPWWYGERASISVLAGAAWRTGDLAFEEFGGDKKTGKKRQPTYSGRIDLYLKVKGQQFIAEAKYYRSTATFVRPTTAEELRIKLEEACKDIHKCSPNGQTKLAILFATPYVAKSQKPRVDELVKAWLASMKSVECSCSARAFPRGSRYFAGRSSYFWPGAAVLIKVV